MKFKIEHLILTFTLSIYTVMSFKGYYCMIQALSTLSTALSADIKRFVLNVIAFGICLIACVLSGWLYTYKPEIKKLIGAAAYISILLPGGISYLWFSKCSAVVFIIYTVAMLYVLKYKEELFHLS